MQLKLCIHTSKGIPTVTKIAAAAVAMNNVKK